MNTPFRPLHAGSIPQDGAAQVFAPSLSGCAVVLFEVDQMRRRCAFAGQSHGLALTVRNGKLQKIQQI